MRFEYLKRKLLVFRTREIVFKRSQIIIESNVCGAIAQNSRRAQCAGKNRVKELRQNGHYPEQEPIREEIKVGLFFV